MARDINDDYVSDAIKTESLSDDVISRLQAANTVRLLHAGIGMVTEAAEYMDALKKHIFYGKPIDKVNLAEEVGDQMWYVAVASDALRTRLTDIMDTNIAKLKKRFPDKFDEKKAAVRDLDAERKILEAVKFSVDALEKKG